MNIEVNYNKDLTSFKDTIDSLYFFSLWNISDLLRPYLLKMRKDSERRLLELGFDTDFIEKIDSRCLTLASLKPMSKEALLNIGFTEIESDLIIDKVRRESIPSEVLEAILLKSGEVCCYCADGNSTRIFHIHHIDEYHKSRNNAEDNLALVCTEHHANIHSKKISIQEQIAKKEAWENLWLIAGEYINRGLSFPFGAFEIIDYKIPGSITEIFEFSSPKGSVCKELARGSISERCINVLDRENVLVLVGESGSGKTTLAKGIAGNHADTVVFKYVISDRSSIENAQEISKFLELAQKKLILIIDDANTKLKGEQLETIVKSGSHDQKIILVITRNTFSDLGNLEPHFLNYTEYLSWISIKEQVSENLLKYETTIVEYLNEKKINFDGHSIGYTVFDHRLDRLVRKYADSTGTIWQFIFLLAGGILQTDQMLRELRSQDRFDILVLFISIKQIAKVEDGTSLEEILNLYNRNNNLNKTSKPDTVWLKEKLDELCERRILVEVRGKYKTVHRELARSFIETSYSFYRIDCSELLDEVFKDFSRAKEIMILWSWLRYGAANDYTKNWAGSLSMEHWKELSEECMKHGLSIISALAQHLTETTIPNQGQIANYVFSDKAGIIAKLINEQRKGTLYYFRHISAKLSSYCPEIIKPILNEINEQKFVDLIKNADIEIFDDLTWLFHDLTFSNPEWAIKFRGNFKFSDFHSIMDQKYKGQISLICNVVKFYRDYIGDLKRSEFKYIIELICRKISVSHLNEIEFPELHFSSLLELYFYPNDIELLLNSINLSRITNDFENATPRYWGKMLSLSMLGEYSKSTFSKEFVDGLDLNRVTSNIEKHYQENPHEFRLMLYQLAYGSISKKRKFAKLLQPMVENLMKRFPEKQDFEDVLKAFNRLDRKSCIESCIRLAKNEPIEEIKVPHDISDTKSEIEMLEKKGDDYDLTTFLIQKKDD